MLAPTLRRTNVGDAGVRWRRGRNVRPSFSRRPRPNGKAASVDPHHTKLFTHRVVCLLVTSQRASQYP
eukprot:11217225-Lingulodinium_polyedra.AAC.1